MLPQHLRVTCIRWITHWVLGAVLLSMQSLSCQTAFAQDPPQSEMAINSIVEQFIGKNEVPGISIAVSHKNQLVYSRGFGLANVEQSVPVLTTTRFRTASIAKPMTAALILSLVEDGKVDLDGPVFNYVPEFPEKPWPVTSRQLLGHLAGIRHYRSTAEASSTTHFFSLKSALQTFVNDPLLHEPGTKYRYSSFGYNLLGSVAEGAAKSDFMTLLNEHVLTPAGMTHTLQDDSFAVIPGRASGYFRATKSVLTSMPDDHDFVEGELYNSTLHDTSAKVPGGGLLSTAEDLVRFATALNQRKVLNDKSLTATWTQQTTADGSTTGYGLGWNIGRKSDRKAVWHGGAQSGTSTMLLLYPDTGTCVAVMSNLQRLDLMNLAISIAQVVDPPVTEYGPAIEKLQAAIRYEVEQKALPAFSISLVDQDQVVWAAGFGFQDAEKKVPASANTVYRVGSVSKLFTDIAVMQLVQDGKLDLDTPIEQCLPEFQPRNPFGVSLTLRQLMSHQSGLVRESPVGHYFDPTEPTLASTVASLDKTSLVYKPQTRTKYSNAAIAVVGAVLEKHLDVSHPEQVQQSILGPLEMHSSSFVVGPTIENNLATGWMRTYDDRRFEAPKFLLGTGPAGNMYSNVLDLSKFISCLFREGRTDSGSILEPEFLNQMMTPLKDSDGKSQGFGLGFHVQQLDGYSKVGHGGAVYGFSTQLEALPERKVGVAAAASLDGTNGVVSRLTDFALRLMLATQDGKPLPSYRTTIPLPPERAKDLVGKYRESGGNQTLKIFEYNGRVYMQHGAFRHELKAAADDGTIITDDEFSFSTSITQQTDGKLAVGKKSFERLPNEPPAEIPARWRGLIGEYGWDHNTLYILEDEGKLCALIEWFYYYPLQEISENVFAFPDTGLYHGEQLIFSCDSTGTASKVNAAEVVFMRREVGTKDGETFKITPVKPIDNLRAEATASKPPVEQGDFRDSELAELTKIDSTIKLDIRYATTNNFTGAVFYKQPRAFLQRPAAEALARAHSNLRPLGLGLLIHDAYRPWHVTKMFWDATPSELRNFVANPAKGSRHNRGCAVDLTLYDLATGEPIQMVSGYDEFSPRSFPLYPGGTSRQRWYRELLRRTMESEGFTVYEFEWWHFDFKDWKSYRIGNTAFEELTK